MFGKRFLLLVTVLVALNVALWFAAPGLALRRGLITQLFGSKMVRAQVHLKTGQDWNLDRGVITQVDGTQLTLREFDGKIVSIPVSGSTKVIRLGRRLSLSQLAPRWRVVVEWPPFGAAQSVDVERIPRHHKRRP
jgi:hypothetical protein